MTTEDYPRFTLRVSPILLQKLEFIAHQEGRTKNKQIEQILIKTITEFEENQGKIQLDNK